MAEIARKLLDEWLGPDRNKPQSQKGSGGLNYWDAEVCKHYLVDFCPHLLFQNTKSDLGVCPKRYHEDSLKERYQREASQHHRDRYERDFHDLLERLVMDMERRMRRGRERVDPGTLGGAAAANPLQDELEEKRILLDLQIKEKLAAIERAGERGQVEEAQAMMGEMDRLRVEMDRLRQAEQEAQAFHLEKRMEVCQTCGSLLVVGDLGRRADLHFEGKQHLGWARIRQVLEDYRRRHAGTRGTEQVDHERARDGDFPRHDRHRDEHRDAHRDGHRDSREQHHRHSHEQRHRDGREHSHRDSRDQHHREDYRRESHDHRRDDRREKDDRRHDDYHHRDRDYERRRERSPDHYRSSRR